MNRRDFLSTALAGAASAATPALAAAASSAPSTQQAAEPQLAPPPPGVEYFTHQRLAELIDLSKPIDDLDFQLVCYVCNLWHPTPVLEQWYGKGFTEWEIGRRAKALYEGHDQPKRPLWGYYKEAEVEWATREIDLAASAGIHAFMVDWYWHDGAMFMHEWLEDAFLKSPSREKMQFAIMWANHPWTNIWLSPKRAKKPSSCRRPIRRPTWIASPGMSPIIIFHSRITGRSMASRCSAS